jgi:hypothetical protein
LNRYTLPLGAILSLAAALLLACGYARLPCHYGIVRGLIGLGLCAGLYAAAGAASVLFACMCGLIEFLGRKSVVAGTVILISGVAVPYLAGTQAYQVSPQDAFVRLTALEYDFSPPLASSALYAVLPLSMILVTGWPLSLLWRPRSGRQTDSAACEKDAGFPTLESRRAWLLRTTSLIVAGASVAWLTFDPCRHAILAADYHTRHRQWDQVLAAAKPLRWTESVFKRRTDERLAATRFSFHYPVAAATPAPLLPTRDVAIHDINLALAKKGQLLDCMFQYPQRMGSSVVRLLPDDEGAYVAHSYNPDVLLELGDVNQAERVACESLANVGPRPWLLERLVLINVLKGRPQAARTCLNLMACDPRRRAWSDALRRELDRDPSLSGHPGLEQVRSRMYRVDHVGRLGNMDPDEQMLRYLLVANPHNRLAFDYLTAHYLLTLRDDKVAENMRHLAAFGYTHVPRHCEESLLLRARLVDKAADLRRFAIRPETVARFDAFQRDLSRSGGPGGPKNLQVRNALLGRYGDTYWFYALFGDTFFRPERPMATSRPGEGS